jgi:hypothetical protein
MLTTEGCPNSNHCLNYKTGKEIFLNSGGTSMRCPNDFQRVCYTNGSDDLHYTRVVSGYSLNDVLFCNPSEMLALENEKYELNKRILDMKFRILTYGGGGGGGGTYNGGGDGSTMNRMKSNVHSTITSINDNMQLKLLQLFAMKNDVQNEIDFTRNSKRIGHATKKLTKDTINRVKKTLINTKAYIRKALTFKRRR